MNPFVPLFHLFIQRLAVCRTTVFFPCGSVYLMQNNRIGIRKSGGKFGEQRCSARIGMRHKIRNDTPAGIKLVYALERFMNCSGMMSVIVHKEDTVYFAQNFATPLCTLKRSKTVLDYAELVGGNFFPFLSDKPDYQRNCGCGIKDAVFSRNTDAEIPVKTAQGKNGLPVLDAERSYAVIAVCRFP